ncbi:uncharacterized protein LOC132708823 [Cylas formicarius]|uniref:uncharacterized protein LOC132708823 n=1 Tax=Cylas formicarius TaxID=197179 RepID=UPI002958D403|nr:uncharacterized protein LOC132708823 [Cylas formicarius]
MQQQAVGKAIHQLIIIHLQFKQYFIFIANYKRKSDWFQSYNYYLKEESYYWAIFAFLVCNVFKIMTNYWWMHWFWITFYLHVISGETLMNTLHSIATTDLPTVTLENFEKSLSENATFDPPSTTSSSKSISKASKNFTSIKYVPTPNKNSIKSKLMEFSEENNSSRVTDTNKELTVINTNVNLTEYQPDTDNLTYNGEDINNNQSLIQNSERLGIEEEITDIEKTNGNLSAAGITGITLGCIIVVGVVCVVTFFVYRTHGFNRPQVLNDRCSNPDSSGYIDDASVRDNSEEMYSLDNDSFLNSLEAMTIQNYWTDTVKHTKL